MYTLLQERASSSKCYYNSKHQYVCPKKSSFSKFGKYIVIGVVIILVIIAICLFLYLRSRRRKNNAGSALPGQQETYSQPSNPPPVQQTPAPTGNSTTGNYYAPQSNKYSSQPQTQPQTQPGYGAPPNQYQPYGQQQNSQQGAAASYYNS